MENLVAFAEALAAPIVGTPNMLNYLPEKAKPGAKGVVWTGLVSNWAPAPQKIRTSFTSSPPNSLFSISLILLLAMVSSFFQTGLLILT